MYKLLIVDDEKMIREGIRASINWSSIGIDEVFLAENGTVALRTLQDQNIDMMVTDINMTGMSGLDLIAKCKHLFPQLRVIVLSGYDDFEYVRSSFRLDVLDYLLKPIDENVFVSLLKKQIKSIESEKKSVKQKVYEKRTKGTAIQLQFSNIFFKIFHGDEVTQEELNFLQESANFDVSKYYQVCLCVFPLRDEIMNQKTDVFHTTFSSCLMHIDIANRGFTLIENEQKIIIILKIEEEGCLEQCIENLKNEIIPMHDIVPQFYYGNKIKGLKNLTFSYQEAQLKREEVTTPIQQQLQIKKSIFGKEPYADIFAKLKRHSCQLILQQDAVRSDFDVFVQSLQLYTISEEEVRTYCFDLVSNLYYTYYNKTNQIMKEGVLQHMMMSLQQANKDEAISLTEGYVMNIYQSPQVEMKKKNIHSILCYIQQNLNQDVSVSSLAQKFNYSANYFSRFFKKEMGIGCNEYIARLRLEKTKELLEITNFPTGKIAEFVGYNDINYFSLVFKKWSGLSPTDYRKMKRKK